jgi:hypothetical protein
MARPREIQEDQGTEQDRTDHSAYMSNNVCLNHIICRINGNKVNKVAQETTKIVQEFGCDQKPFRCVPERDNKILKKKPDADKNWNNSGKIGRLGNIIKKTI